jgi:phytoene synthase
MKDRPPMHEPSHPPSSEPVREVLQRGLPPGSPRHLAVLFTEREARTSLGALYAFEAELRRIAASDSHEAAHARLQWWRGELERLFEGRPSHPIASALQPLKKRAGADLTLLRELLVAADLDLARFTYNSWKELDAYCFRSSGALQLLVAAVVAEGRVLTEQEHRFARQLGAGIRQAEILRDLMTDFARGRLYAPLDELATAGIDAAVLARSPTDGAAARFLADWRGRVRGALQSLPSLLDTRGLRRAQRHGLVLASMHLRLIERLDGTAALASRRFDLEPLGRLWTAWRTALRHA